MFLLDTFWLNLGPAITGCLFKKEHLIKLPELIENVWFAIVMTLVMNITISLPNIDEIRKNTLKKDHSPRLQYSRRVVNAEQEVSQP